ncbi:MAG: hypothetical protein SGPRY_009753, partial [Prymnesium sp.]
MLRGLEETTLRWYFSPDEERQYLFKVPVLLSAVDVSETAAASAHEVSKQTLTISGVGSSGEIVAEPKLLDFGTILISEPHGRYITLINSSSVDLHYSLHFVSRSGEREEREGGEEGEKEGQEEGGREVGLIQCDKLSGNVPARNTVDVRLVLLPDRRQELLFDVMCSLRPGGAGSRLVTPESGESLQLRPPLKVCELAARADYPLVQVVDAR